MVMEVDASGTELAGQAVTHRGAHRRAADVLANSNYTSSASLSQRLTALARLVQIGSARGGADGFSPELIEDAEAPLAKAGGRPGPSAPHPLAGVAGGAGSGKAPLVH